MKNPNKILVKTDEITLDGIKQFYLGVQHESWKTATLFDLSDNLSGGQGKSSFFLRTQMFSESQH